MDRRLFSPTLKHYGQSRSRSDLLHKTYCLILDLHSPIRHFCQDEVNLNYAYVILFYSVEISVSLIQGCVTVLKLDNVMF